jgi:hypothetical protein
MLVVVPMMTMMVVRGECRCDGPREHQRYKNEGKLSHSE